MKKLLLPLLCTFPLAATDLQPWFPPPWQFIPSVEYLYQYENTIQSPLGNFDLNNPINNLALGMNVTVWPDWNGEIEVLFSSNPATELDFSYQATRLTGRYQWLEEGCGDWITLTSGLTLFAVRSSFLTATSCWFHGNFNAEFNAAVGKEFVRYDDWIMRLWSYAGLGFANKGNPWWHSYSAWDVKIGQCSTISALLELVYGMGNNDIVPNEPFPGYAGIRHQFVNVGLGFKRSGITWGIWELTGWYNIHAYNFPLNYYGLGIAWRMPFGCF